MESINLFFNVRIVDEAAFQRAKPIIAAANLKELDDYTHDYEFIKDFFLSMDAYAQLMGDELVAPLQIGIEVINHGGDHTPAITAAAAVTDVTIELPEVWGTLVGTKVPKDAPNGPTIAHDPQPHKGDSRLMETRKDGVTVQAFLEVDEYEDEYHLRYDVFGPNGDEPTITGGHITIDSDQFTLSKSGLRVRVTPKLVPTAPSSGLTFPELLKAANAHYDDGLLAMLPLTADGSLDYPNLQPGLERYLGVELYETYDPTASKDEQIDTAIRAIERTIEDLQTAIDGLRQAPT